MLEHIPLIAFGITYYFQGLLSATAVLIAVSVVVIPMLWKKTGKAPMMHIVTTALLGVMGGATLFSGNPDFIKMKPTVASLLFAIILLGAIVLKKNALKPLLGTAFTMSDTAWNRLATHKAIFFILMAVANEYIWRNFTETQWVQFKLFGFSFGYILFMILHIPFFKKNAKFVNK